MRIDLPRMFSLLLLWGTVSCELHSLDEGSGSALGFSELIVAFDGGVLLSAANVGDELVLVGGQPSSQPGVTPGGPGYLMRWSGNTLCYEADVSEHTLWWIDAPSADRWYAVGEQGTILHQDGDARSDESVETDAVFYGVFDQGDRVHAVGGHAGGAARGEIWERDANGRWSVFAEDLPGVVLNVWQRWFVGDGVAWYLEGDTLVERFPPGGERLRTVHGNEAGDVWAVGGQQTPVMLHWEDDAWAQVAVDPACANNGLNGVWVSPQGDVWIAGLFGGMGAYANGRWQCPDVPLTREHFHNVRGHEGAVLWSGGNPIDAGKNYGTLFHYGVELFTPEMPVEIVPCP